MSKICGAFLRDILHNSSIQCGLLLSDTREYHNQLRHFVQNRTLIDDLTDFRMTPISILISHKTTWDKPKISYNIPRELK